MVISETFPDDAAPREPPADEFVFITPPAFKEPLESCALPSVRLPAVPPEAIPGYGQTVGDALAEHERAQAAKRVAQFGNITTPPI